MMSEAFQKAWIWRVILFKAFNNWFIVVAMAICAQDVDWGHMTPFQKFRLIIMALVAGAKAIEAFMNQDIGAIKKQIAADLDTAIFSRQPDYQFQAPGLPLGQPTPPQTETPKPNTEPK
jgi:hypothetical protein